MNKQRRAELRKISDQLAELMGRVEALSEEEQSAFDNLPESLQGAEKGQAMEGAITALEEAADQMEEAFNSLQEAIGDQE